MYLKDCIEEYWRDLKSIVLKSLKNTFFSLKKKTFTYETQSLRLRLLLYNRKHERKVKVRYSVALLHCIKQWLKRNN